MDQLALALAPDRKHTALVFVAARPDLFRDDFADYLARNFHVYLAFEREADRIWERGRRHYSGRTIVEVLRHESALREAEGSEWKLNDKWTPDLCRLLMEMRPDRAGFFETRAGHSERRVA